ncbi:MAG TPA: acylneuraminate cytidylyltransferase family protein [Gemmatimonadaceae bacterium]|nr:acylneuraminate cytidylyltransferase family protein [Gemmatimonadaceae bacterium]
MTRRIAIIPARGGSKRIPHKNVRNFCGKPMIAYILETARASGLFDVIHVSTEDEHVRKTVENLGLTIDFMRPPELADDYTPIMPVLKYVTDEYADRGNKFDEVWSLMACAPFVESGDFHGAADMLPRAGGHRAVLAVSQYPVPIEWAYSRADDGSLTPEMPGMFAVRSQDIEKKYFDTGTFAAFPNAMVRDSDGPGSDSAYVGYVLERKKAIDIDDESDWGLAESMFHSLHR